MNPEYLEALLIDRAAGELSSEVGGLLDAYLGQNPAAAARAAAIDSTLRLARAAVATPREKPADLDLARLRRELLADGAHARGAGLLRLAASLAVGVGLGWLLRSEVKSPLSPTPAASVIHLISPRVPVTTTDFWSVSRFAPDSIPAQPKKSL